jgi:uncharacterized protein YndB with AHSA1/START domain
MTVRSIADATAGAVRAELEIAAPPETVFHALTDPRELAAWWGSPEMYRTRNWVIDLRVGGRWSAEAGGEGDAQPATVRGEYLEVDPPRVLAYSWEPSWDGFFRTIVRIELQPSRGGTLLKLSHTGFAPGASFASHTEGWQRVLTWLKNHVARAGGAR